MSFPWIVQNWIQFLAGSYLSTICTALTYHSKISTQRLEVFISKLSAQDFFAISSFPFLRTKHLHLFFQLKDLRSRSHSLPLKGFRFSSQSFQLKELSCSSHLVLLRNLKLRPQMFLLKDLILKSQIFLLKDLKFLYTSC